MGSPVDGRVSVCCGKDLWKRYVLSLEWKRVGVIGGESGDEGAGETR